MRGCGYALQFLEGMSEKIKKGIEAAQTDIIKEKEQKEQEEVNTVKRENFKFTVLCEFSDIIH